MQPYTSVPRDCTEPERTHAENMRPHTIVGICGNWAVFVRSVPEWHRVVSFLGPFHVSKVAFLIQLGLHVPASDHVMVGNDPTTGLGVSQDRAAAEEAGWRFILETDFATGTR